VIDNASWHNRLTAESTPPKRAWRKAQIQEWLNDRNISYDSRFTNAELLELAFEHLPPKEYMTNVAASEFNVEIIRLPIKHCMLNPIELAWSQLKGYVRKNNTSFRLSDITTLSQEYIAALDDCSAFIEHARKVEVTFRQADRFLEEEIDPELLDDDVEEEDAFVLESESDNDDS
jgi:hypothetical protein